MCIFLPLLSRKDDRIFKNNKEFVSSGEEVILMMANGWKSREQIMKDYGYSE